MGQVISIREAIARRKIERAMRELSRPYDPAWLIFRVRLHAALLLIAKQRFLVVKH